MPVRVEAAPPAPGTIISGQAVLNYIDLDLDLTLESPSYIVRETPSNIVRVLVGGAPGLELQADRSGTYAPSTNFTFIHTLTNTGNIAGTYTLTPALVDGGGFTPQNLALVIDVNANSAVDPGEPQYPFGPHTVTLAPGQTLQFIITGLVPPSAPVAASFRIRVDATLAETGAIAANIDAVATGAGELQFFKSVSPATAARGGEILYTLYGTNNFPATLGPTPIAIDGVNTLRVVVRDPLPGNIELVSLLAANGGTPLYHLNGTAFHAYVTAAPADLSTVDAVAFAFDTIELGVSFSVSFRARIGGRATGEIVNLASVYSSQPGGAPLITVSNPATVTVPDVAPVIRYYDQPYARIMPASHLGNPLHVQVEAGSCNKKSETVETITVSITSALTGDRESFTATETGPNTGIFRISPVPSQDTAAAHAVVTGDGILQTLERDVLTAELTDCGGVTVRATIFIDPAGVIYDSRTNQPLAGATVTLIDVTGVNGAPGGLARVHDEDGATAVSATQVTGADGLFRYPIVPAGTYRLEITPPADYAFPSVIPFFAQPAGRRIHVDGSYGGSFPVDLSDGTVFLDVPLDTTVATGFVLEKTASRDTAEIGDSVIYTLKLSNSSGAPFRNSFIDDRLPPGFRYERGTARRDGVPIADPRGGIGPHLRFLVGKLDDDASTTFTYRVRLTPGAEKGDGINTAQATSLGPQVLVSNRAQARVRPEAGVFDPSAVIIGTVFVDANGNDIQDPGEPGVPGVRVVLEDGTYAITDAEGQYSIYGQRPVTHVLKLDPHTLPPGAKPGGKSPRFAGDPGSRFVDLKSHELHKANFMLVEPAESLYAAIEARRRQIDAWHPEIAAALATTFRADGTPTLVTDPQSREASGVIGSGHALPGSFENVLPPGTLTPANSPLPPSPVAAVPLVDLEHVTAGLTDAEPGFIDLRHGDTLPYDRVTVRVKGAAEAKLELLLNGEPVSESHIGKIVRQRQAALQAVEYVAVQLKPGLNHLELVQRDLFGNARARSLIDVTAPGRMATLDIAFSTPVPAADGRTAVEVRVTAVDAAGVPVTASLPLTLETTLGRWEVEDANPREPGTQVFMKDGVATYRLIPPVEPGEARIVVSSGVMKAERRLAFLPELRPMIAAGIIEGRFALNRLSSSAILPLDPGDAFESELRQSAGIGNDGTASGRAAFYLKGKIKGDALLTVAYDSDKRKDDVRLFRDIDPDAYYPVYGDSSVKGYDAQSTGKLYVRIDKNRSWFLLGDFNTRADSEVRQLGDYNRSFNGVRVQHESSRFKGGLWASDDSTDQVIREIPANGTSGPFNFAAGDGVLGSETVEILVRDRNQRSVILKTTTLARYTDYDFEPFSGRLLLRRPVASVDENFNPQSIRISYEVDSGGPKFWVYGGDAQVKLHERLEVGASFARDENPVDPYDLQSVNATFRLAAGTYLMAEGARSDSLLSVTDSSRTYGYAGRIDLRHQSELTEARAYFGKTEESFNNPSSTLNAGRVEGSAKVTHQLAPRTQLIGEGIYTEDIAGSGNLKGVRADIAYTFENQVRIAIGGRYSEETQTPANPGDSAADTPLTVRSVRTRVDAPVPRFPQASVFAEYEQDIVKSGQRLVAAGGAYQVSTKTRLYARHEFISSLGSDFELNTSQQNNRTLLGLETEYLRDAYFYNEYRVLDAIDGGQAEASTGLRNLWNVADGLRLNTTFERVTPFDGSSTNESTAATLAVDYTRPADWKATGRLEGRWADTSDNYLSTLGYARKLDEQWTFLGRSILNTQLYDDPASADLWQGRLLAGLAWRQAEKDRWNALFRYEYKYERGSSALGDEDMRRQVHTAATSVNYQPDRRWVFAGHYAGKFVIERGGYGGDADYFAHLLAGRAIFEITAKWDAGLNLAVTFSESFGNARYAVGPEIGRVFTKNVRIGFGYNLVGFTDRDFDTASTSQGFFLSLRIKFDENLLKWASFKRTEDAR
ncbi:hypothetical protein OH491_04135 [Termitidicoccus mucosus]